LGGHAEGVVEVLGLRFGGCGLADAQHGPRFEAVFYNFPIGIACLVVTLAI
jgi:hypothetical protein